VRRTLRRSHTWNLKHKHGHRGSLVDQDSSENSDSRSRGSSFTLDESSMQSLQRVQKLNVRKRVDHGSGRSRSNRPTSFSSRSRMDDLSNDALSMEPPRARARRSMLRNSSLLQKFNELHGHKTAQQQQTQSLHSRSAFMFAAEDSNASFQDPPRATADSSSRPGNNHSHSTTNSNSSHSTTNSNSSHSTTTSSRSAHGHSSKPARAPLKKRSLFGVLSKDRFEN
jgi:hypothetical protein